MSRLLQRTPTQTTKTHQPDFHDFAQGLWDMWSSCCSSRCTCPRTNWGYLLVGMHQRATSPVARPQHHQHHAAAQARPPSTGLFAANTARRNRNASTPQMPHLGASLLQRTPTQTTKTRQLSDCELDRGLWDMWSSCCSSRCTCPRTNWARVMKGRFLVRKCHVTFLELIALNSKHHCQAKFNHKMVYMLHTAAPA
jgi:hypothetical protein